LVKTYKWILFDADDTLFHFDAYTGLQRMFANFSVDFSVADYHEYELTNKPLWIEYQNGSIGAQQLQHQRFQSWADKLQVSTQDLNNAYMAMMAQVCTPMEGAMELLNSLKGKIKLGIITNGFTQLQQARLEHTGLKEYFDLLVISEQVGSAKPHKAIFDHAVSQMGVMNREHVLMVGDNPDTDILGGNNAGLHTCWLNVKNNTLPEGVVPHYQVASLSDLEKLILDIPSV